MLIMSENPCISAQLRSLIYYSLDNEHLQNALFHAGRLHGLDPRNGDAAHLLALCHFRLGQYKSAYDYSRDKGMRAQHLGCAYIFAQASLALGKFGDGITALERSRGLWATRNHWNRHSESSRRHLPDSASVNYLLGKLWMAYGEPNKAVEFLVEALKQNPFMWDGFAELCQTGMLKSALHKANNKRCQNQGIKCL
jgi:anaphase-promoting complex subunit 3